MTNAAQARVRYAADPGRVIARVRCWQAANPAKVLAVKQRWRAANPLKHAAHWRVAAALRSGALVRQPCEMCGDRAHAHHDDYTKPLEVRWLCRVHHAAHHQQEAKG